MRREQRKLRRPTRRRLDRIPTLEPLESRELLSGLDGLQVPWVIPDAGNSSRPAALPIQPASTQTAPTTPLEAARQEYGLTGTGQTVVVIDTGVAYDHEAFGGGFGSGYQVVGGWDVAEQDSDPYDDAPAGFHGTHVAGIIASQDPTRLGVAPGVDLVAVRVFDDLGRSDLGWVEEALQWVEKNQDAFRYPVTTVNLSLGTNWNSTQIPSGTTLEDELSRLREDGILVVAAAGNAFASYGTPGLAYPAASPYVLPVGSVGADGNLSRFSQRQQRMIAAPGESIESTVPDHLLSRDGRADDWMRLSGTSMAAPYVSGAAALINEAYSIFQGEFATPQQIIDVMRSTSGSVYDAATSQTYNVLRIDEALDAVIPQDDWGASISDAGVLGVVPSSSSGTMAGAIERIGDTDLLRVRFERDGTFSFRVDVLAGRLRPTVRLIDSAGNTVSGDSQFDVQAGSEYLIEIRDGSAIGRYEVAWEFEEAEAAAGAVRVDGRTLFVLDQGRAANIDIELGSVVTVTVDGQRTEWSVSDIDRIEIAGSGNDDRVRLVGTDAAETLRIRSGGWTWSSSGIVVAATGVEQAMVDGGLGNDLMLAWGSSGADELEGSAERITWRSPGFAVTATGMTRIYADGSGAGNDVLRLTDGIGNDRLVLKPGAARLVGRGYQINVTNFDETYVTANSGGTDVAWLYGVAQDDTLMRRAGGAQWRTDTGIVRDVEGFERLLVLRSNGSLSGQRGTAARSPESTPRRRVVFGPRLPSNVATRRLGLRPASIERHMPDHLPDRLAVKPTSWPKAVDQVFAAGSWNESAIGPQRPALFDPSGESTDDASPLKWLDVAPDSSFNGGPSDGGH